MHLPPFVCTRPRRAHARTALASRLLAAVLAAAWLPGPAGSAQERAAAPPPLELSLGIHLIHAELADTDANRMLGLMYRRGLEANHGMLFVFDQTAQHCMWMRNTYIPLSVAFLDPGGAVINVEEMKAQTDDSHCALRPARFALEMSAHWFSQHGARPGAVIQGIPSLSVRK